MDTQSSRNISMQLFEIYGKWSVQANKEASKQASKHTHVHCSHASMGLTQARPNISQNKSIATVASALDVLCDWFLYHRKNLSGP